MKLEIFAIRCFLGKKRKFTHLLTKRQARIFRECARTLDRYLTYAYKLRKK